MRALGIDFGERHIGVALSDPTGTIASPLTTVRRRMGKRMPLSRLEQISREKEVEELVVGLPLDPQGKETEWCHEVRAAGDALAERLGVPVTYVDERFTTVRAERSLRGLGLPLRKRREKGRVDAMAAALVLQRHLDGPHP